MRTLLAMLAVVGQLSAANWYVDISATGAGNGTSWADAWPDMPNVVWGSSGVTAGDTLYISGGATSQTYTNIWIATATGTASAPVTIRVGQDAGHNGTVVFDGTELGQQFESPVAFARLAGNHYVVDGSVGGERRMTFQNIINTNMAEGVLSGRSLASAIYTSGSGGHRVSFITASNVNNGVNFSSATNTVVHSCWIKARGDAGVRLNNSLATGYDEHLVYSNSITVMWRDGLGGPDGVQGQHGITATHNEFRIERITDEVTSGQHPDYFQVRGRWFKCLANDFENIGDSAIDMDQVYLDTAVQDVLIANNTFRITEEFDTSPEYIRLYNTAKVGDVVYGAAYFENVRILNNTFIDNTQNANVVRLSYENDGGGTGNIIANNIFVNTGSASEVGTLRIMGLRPDAVGSTPSDVVITNNLFYHPTPANFKVDLRGVIYTGNEWKESVDSSTVTNAPTFVAYTPSDSANDLRLSPSDTAARGAGLPFNSEFEVDADGNSRGEVWDMGAFQVTTPGSLLVWLTFEDEFEDEDYIQDWSGWGNHAWRFGRPGYPTNWPGRALSSLTPGGRAGMGYAGDFYWYDDGWGLFGRSGDYAGITNTASMTNMQTATIAVWARHESGARVGTDNWFASQNATLLSAATSTGVEGTWDLGRFSFQNTLNNVRFMVLTNSSFTGGNNGRYVVEFPDIGTSNLGDTTNWHHYAVTWDNGTITGYFDGQQISQTTLHVDSLKIGKNPTNPTYWIGVGCNTHGGTPPLEDEEGVDYPNHGWWNGYMDDVRIYDTALSASGIEAIVDSPPVAIAAARTAIASIVRVGSVVAHDYAPPTPELADVEINATGWQAEVLISDATTGGTYNYGLAADGFLTGNETFALQITSPGYSDLGAAIQATRTNYGTIYLRNPYPDHETANETQVGDDVRIRLVLSDYVYASDTVEVVGLAGLYTTGTPSPAFTGSAVNSSTIPHQPVVAQWSVPGFRVIEDSNLDLRVTAFHQSAQQGRPVRVVQFVATDSSGNSFTNWVTTPTVDATWGDAMSVVEYVGLFATNLFVPGLITCNATAYPWVGDSGSVASTWGTDGGSIYFGTLTNAVGVSRVRAIVDLDLGDDATGVAATPASWASNPNPAPFATIGGALNAVYATNTALGLNLGLGGGIVYLREGSHTWMGATVNPANSQAIETLITAAPGADSDLVTITTTGGSTVGKSGSDIWTIRNVGINSADSTLFSAYRHAWFDSLPILNVTAARWIGTGALAPWSLSRSTVSNVVQGIKASGTHETWPWLVRGNEFVGAAQGYTASAFIGNAKRNVFYNMVDANAAGVPPADRPFIFAFNRWETTSGNIAQLGAYQGVTNGVAFVQNVMEHGGANEATQVMSFYGNNTAVTVTNVMVWNNTMAGFRTLYCYNNQPDSDPAWHEHIQTLNNISDRFGMKSDYPAGTAIPDGGRIGNWSVMHGVGWWGNAIQRVVSPGGDFDADWYGLFGWGDESQTTPEYARFVNRGGWTGAEQRPLGGDYRLLSDSPVFTRNQSKWVLPYDIMGVARGVNDPPGAHAEVVAP